MKKLLSKIDELSKDYISLWEALCNIESPTNFKQGIDNAGNFLIQIAKKKNWSIKHLHNEHAGNAFSITINADSDEFPVVFSGHIDTVHPLGIFGAPAVTIDHEKIHGPGVMDCKGGVVASMLALDALYQTGFTKRPVKLVVQTDEETSSVTSNKRTIDFMIDESKNALAFLNTEGTHGNTAILERKGILRFRYNIFEKAVHSAKCSEGSNAITEAAHKIIELEKLKDPNGLTCNCGVIEGGTTPNSVAEKCAFLADIRFADNELYDHAVTLCKAIADKVTVEGCCCQIEKLSERPAMPLVEANEALLNTMNSIYEEWGLPVLSVRTALSGSDAAYTTQAGIPTVDGLGVDGNYIHSVNEFAYISSLVESAKRLAVIAYSVK